MGTVSLAEPLKVSTDTERPRIGVFGAEVEPFLDLAPLGSVLPGRADGMAADGQPLHVALVSLDGPEAEALELLSELRRVSPTTLRVVLHPDETPFQAEACRWAHHVWARPISAARLRLLLTDALGLSASADETLDGVRFPVMSATVVKLLEFLDSEDPDINGSVRLVESDPGLAAAVLGVANSAFYGLPRRVATVGEATRFIGLNGLRNTVLTCSLLPRGGAGGATARSLQSDGVMRMRLVREIGGSTKQLVGTAALLQDVGQVVMLNSIPFYSAGAHTETGTRALEWELQEFGFHRFQVGRALLQRWRLPDSVCALVGSAGVRFHAPRQGLSDRVLLKLSNGLVDELTGQEGGGIDEGWVDALGLTHHLPEWREIARDLSMHWPAA